MNNIYNTITKENIKVEKDQLLSDYTSFKIGGKAKLFVTVNNNEELSKVLKICNANKYPVLILGNGSNLLISDKGINAVVIKMEGNFKEIKMLTKNTIYCGAAVTLSKLCSYALKNSLTGLEFAWGIPGTVGGAVFMNAGAYGGEMADVISKAFHIDSKGDKGELKLEDLNLSYRHSIYKDNKSVVTGVTIQLKEGNKKEIKNKMDTLMQRRLDKQPLEFPSGGSVFKRPEGNYAGTLIEKCGLKGKTVGGAQVSEKHAGFIINIGNATCDDVCSLIKIIQETVYNKTGYNLEREIIYLED